VEGGDRVGDGRAQVLGGDAEPVETQLGRQLGDVADAVSEDDRIYHAVTVGTSGRRWLESDD
jgi:hypothetical protein